MNDIRPVRVVIRRHISQVEEKDAWTTSAPGLLAVSLDGKWLLAHERSGTYVPLSFDDPEQAQAAAARLGELRDWTRHGDDLDVAGLILTSTWKDLRAESGPMGPGWMFIGRDDVAELSGS